MSLSLVPRYKLPPIRAAKIHTRKVLSIGVADVITVQGVSKRALQL